LQGEVQTRLNVLSDITANKSAAYKLLGLQVAITVITALVLYVLVSLTAAYSALLGGFAYIIPNSWFIRLVYRGTGQITPQTMVSRFYAGESVKLLLTGIIFALCFYLVKELHAGALFLTFIMMIVINLAGLARIGV
jgi:ATP synthase protein I